ncbi:MAG TPA: hypothetical protein VGQ53_23285, partial [Chitinophagaceae bacterium]|nr:hypothetical protein [Chitinophagaceae bacterium]
MRLVKSTTLRNLLIVCGLQLITCNFLYAQENSPYSRYGLGDIAPSTNIETRGMAGISAAYADPLSINFSNPASYSQFFSYKEERSKKVSSGRVLFDVGINYTSHTLREGNTPEKFTSSDILFSYLQVGLPVKKNWGLNFGLRQVTKIYYKINHFERLYDPNTGMNIDSAVTNYNGDGGAFLASLGSGIAIKNFSIGFNFGYLFGKKQFGTKRIFVDDSVAYSPLNYNSQASFGDIYGNAGIQYKIDVSNKLLLRLGAYGNLKHEINTETDLLRMTYVSTQGGDQQLDSVFAQKGVKGKIVYPSGYGLGFIMEKKADRQNNKYGNWMIGVDYVQNNWGEYRFYGTADSVQNAWQFRVGGQIRPEPKKNYFSNVTYRAGIFIGQDYVHVVDKLPLLGLSFGMGLPLPNFNSLART